MHEFYARMAQLTVTNATLTSSAETSAVMRAAEGATPVPHDSDVKRASAFGWRAYLGEPYGCAHVPAYAATARATDLGGLPPAYVYVGNVDGLLDKASDHATGLSQAGAAWESRLHPGAPHGLNGSSLLG